MQGLEKIGKVKGRGPNDSTVLTSPTGFAGCSTDSGWPTDGRHDSYSTWSCLIDWNVIVDRSAGQQPGLVGDRNPSASSIRLSITGELTAASKEVIEACGAPHFLAGLIRSYEN